LVARREDPMSKGTMRWLVPALLAGVLLLVATVTALAADGWLSPSRCSGPRGNEGAGQTIISSPDGDQGHDEIEDQDDCPDSDAIEDEDGDEGEDLGEEDVEDLEDGDVEDQDDCNAEDLEDDEVDDDDDGEVEDLEEEDLDKDDDEGEEEDALNPSLIFLANALAILEV